MQRLLAIFGLLTLIAAVVWVADPSPAQQQSAKSVVENMIENMLATEGRSVGIEGLSISLNGNVSVSKVEVRDGETPWLVLQGLALDWQPLSLFKSKLEINSLTVDSIDLARLPQTQEGGVAAPQEMSSLTNADIGKLTIGTFHVGQPVLGEEITLKADGAAQIVQTPAEIRLQFDAARTDGKEGTLKANIVLDPQTRALNAQLDLQEAKGGLVSHLLRLNGDPAVGLTIDAKGTLDDWAGSYALALDSRPVIAGDAKVASDAGTKQLTINGSGQVAELAPAALANVLRGESQLMASVAFPAQGTLADIQRIWIDNDAYQLRATGRADWSGDTSDLKVELRSKSDAEVVSVPLEGASGAVDLQGLSADFEIKGDLAAPHWTLGAQAASLVSDVARIDKFAASLTGSGISPALNPVTVAGTVNGDLGQGRKASLPPLAIGPLAANLAATWQNSGEVALAPISLKAGQVELDANGSANVQTGTIDLAVSGNAHSPGTGVASIDRLLTGDVALSGRFASGDAGRYRLTQLRLKSSGLDATLDGQAGAADADLGIALTLPDLSLIDARMAGAMNGDATLSGPWTAPETWIRAKGDRIMLMGKELTGAALDAKVKLSPEQPMGAIQFSGTMAGKPVSLAADIATAADGTRSLRNIALRANETRLTGAISLPPGNGAPAGALDLVSPDLGDIGPFLLMDLKGSLNGSIAFDGDRPEGRMTVKFDGRNIGAEGFTAETAAGAFTVDAPFTAPRPAGSASLGEARIRALSFAKIEATATATGAATYEVAAKAQGPDISGDAAAEVRLAGQDMEIAVSRFAGLLQGVPVKATAPFTITSRGGAISIGKAALAAGKGSITLNGRVSPDLDVDAALSQLSLAAFEKLAGVPGLQGTVSGTMHVGGQAASPSGRFALNGSNVSFAALRAQGIAPVSFTGTGSLANRKLSIKADARANAATSATISGDIGLAAPYALNLRVAGKTDGAGLAQRLADSGMRFSAASTFDLTVTGAADSPAIDGTITIANATIGDAAGRFIIRNGRGQFAIAKNLLRIVSLTGTTGKNGSAAFAGTITLSGDYPANITGRINNGIYTDGAFVTTRYDGNLTLTGPLLGTPTFGGEIVLEKTKITLSSVPPRAIAAPDVKHRNAPPAVRRQAEELRERQGAAGSNVLLNLRLRAGTPISISGRGLNVTMGGGLTLTGSLQNIGVAGAFRLERGSLKLLARRLDFESGRLDFDDGFDPRINLVAVSRQSDATITLTIAGRASAPDIVVTSSPQMPQEEAMARLIFDRSMLQLSPLQIAQIASYVATLSGGRDTGVLTGLQNALGADWLDVIQTETGETAVSVGKRINDKLSVGVEQTTRSNTSRVTIDLNIGKNLKARGAYGTDGASRAGIYYEKDY